MSEKRCRFVDKRVSFTNTLFAICINCEVKATFVYALQREGTNTMFIPCYMQLGFCGVFF